MKKLLGGFTLLVLSFNVFSACTSTITTATNLATAVTNAAVGSTICLTAGSYTADLSGINKAGEVIVQSASGRTATVDLTLVGSSHLTLQNLTISSLAAKQFTEPTNNNIKILNNTFTGQFTFTGNGWIDFRATLQHNIIDGNTFDGITSCPTCDEGRLFIWGGNDLIVSNNHFGGGGADDGIQIGGYGTVISHNVFEGIYQTANPKHTDSLQFLSDSENITVDGNYFITGSDYLVIFDGTINATVTNNVFAPGDGLLSGQPIVFGAAVGLNFSHNTVKGSYYISTGGKLGAPLNSNNNFVKNLFDGIYINDNGPQPSCTSCSYTSNMYTSSGLQHASETGVLIGTPTYAGGASPTTYAGYALTVGSTGYNADNNLIKGIVTAADTIAPTITTRAPASAATGVSTLATVTATFSEPMLSGTITGTAFNLKKTSDSSAVTATVTYNAASNTATLTPSSALLGSTQYTATITTGVQDSAGNALATTSTWNFTTSAPDTTAPTVSSVNPVNVSTNISQGSPVAIAFSELMNTASISTSSIELRKTSDNTLVAATVTYNATNNTATLDPTSSLLDSTQYTLTVKGGGVDPRVKDFSLNPLASNFTSTFTTKTASVYNCASGTNKLWPANPTPTSPNLSDGTPLELGVKFKSTTDGAICGIRFYKGTSNTGTHLGRLWTSTGTMLATATFTGETASGWQQVLFSSPVEITADTTYVASYSSPTGGFAANTDYFATNLISGNLYAYSNAETGNGVFLDGTGFPTITYSSSNYWVDVIYANATVAADITPPTVTGSTPLPNVVNASITSSVIISFNEQMNAASISTSSFELRNTGTNALIASSVGYDSLTFTATLTPNAPLTNSTQYTVIVKGGGTDPRVKDSALNALAVNYTYTFTTVSTGTSVIPVPVASFNFEPGCFLCDSVGGNNGSSKNPPSSTTGAEGNAALFDGINDTVDAPLPYTVFTSNEYSITGWFNRDNDPTSNTLLFVKEDLKNVSATLYNQWMFSLAQQRNYSNNYSVGTGFNNTIGPNSGIITAGQWVHIAITYKNSRQKIYVNGVLVANQRVSKPRASQFNKIKIGGGDNYGRPFKGSIDSLMVFKEALTDQQIQYLSTNASVDNPIVISGQSNKVYDGSGQKITNSNGHCIIVSNSTNITIKNYYIENCSGKGINVHIGNKNIKILNNYLYSTGGIYSLGSEGVHTEGNVIRKVTGTVLNGQTAACVQYAFINSVTDGSSIIDNTCFNEKGFSANEDGINSYQSLGTENLPIIIAGNTVVGHSDVTVSGSGIVLGDWTGGYMYGIDNLIYAPGNAGIIAAGGHHMVMDSNISINHTDPRGTWGYEARAVPSDQPCNDIYIFNNVSRFKGFNGQNKDLNADITCFGASDNSKNINNQQQAIYAFH